MFLVVLVGQADPIDQLLVQVATTTDLNHHHSHKQLALQGDYSVAPIGKHSAEVVPIHQVKKKVIPTAVPVPLCLRRPMRSRLLVVEGSGFERPRQPVAVEHPKTKAAVEQQGFVPIQEFVVVEGSGFERPRQPVAVEQAFAVPILPVAVVHPIR
jgi:hypothetical protein